ncbi:MAG TPA: hypothetical protein VFR32_11290 [Gaiellaceae bacterium]|nr:hypothetical protein [Gaiellaceae bacterium]
MRRIALIAGIAAIAAGCGGGSGSALPTGSERVTLDPADFTTEITNPYWPMAPGDRWLYRETDGEGGEQRVEVTVTAETKTIAGIEARVVHDVVSEDGEVIEDTLDWYAQDADGNIWYLGEDTKEYENGKVKTTAGSWEHGVDGAQAGIIVPAQPEPGLAYREEYYEGEAEDGAEVLTLGARANVPYGTFDGLLQTRNFSPLEPNVVEEKLYARDVGPVLVVGISGGAGREELLSFEPVA